MTHPHQQARYITCVICMREFYFEGSMTLKQSFAGAVASVALMSAAHAADMQPVLKAPGAVEQQATGYVEIYGGWASTRANISCFEGCDPDPLSKRLSGGVLGGAGRANYWITREVSVQVDAQAEGTSQQLSSQELLLQQLSGNSDRFSTHSYLGGGHWSWRSPQQYLFGLFAAAGDAGGVQGLTVSSQRHGLIGAEAQWYWNQFTLYAQGGYDTTLGTIDSPTLGNSDVRTDRINAWFIRGTGRYFVNPNVLIEGTIMYANGRINFNDDLPSEGFQTWSWQAKAEWRFPTAPFSVFAKYQGSRTTYDSSELLNTASEKVTDHRVLLGLKLHMGDKTLQQTDRTGATLDIVSPLANPTSPLSIF
jgi:opacity protein-like surface antigen